MFPKHFIGIRIRRTWKGKVYSYLVPMKGKIGKDEAVIFCPYIPLIKNLRST